MATVLIEFFGMPGCGKTFIAKNLAEALRDEGCIISDRMRTLTEKPRLSRIIEKVGLILRCLILDKKVFSMSLAFIIKFIDFRSVGWIKVFFNWLYIVALIEVESRKVDIILLDQGIGQAIWSTLFYGNKTSQSRTSNQWLEDFLAVLSIDILHIVNLHADNKLIEKRIHNRVRGSSPLDGGQQNNWQQASQALTDTQELIKQLDETTSYCYVQDITNNSDGLDINLIDKIKEAVLIESVQV